MVLGGAVLEQPVYQGSRRYRVEGGPVIDVRYYDIAFASVGEGIGINLIRGKTYQAGVSLPGSSKTFVMLAGPSITFANKPYMQKTFGVSSAQAAASSYAPYQAYGGDNAFVIGFSATKFVTPHWLFNFDLAVNRLLGSARDSPITQTQAENLFEMTSAYRW